MSVCNKTVCLKGFWENVILFYNFDPLIVRKEIYYFQSEEFDFLGCFRREVITGSFPSFARHSLNPLLGTPTLWCKSNLYLTYESYLRGRLITGLAGPKALDHNYCRQPTL